MNTQWLIVMAIVVIFALAGILGFVYLNNTHMLANNVNITDTSAPMGPVDGVCILAVSSQGEGTVVIDPYKTSYDQGESVTLRAVSTTGHKFIRWEGAVSSTQEKVTVNMTGRKVEVRAVFD